MKRTFALRTLLLLALAGCTTATPSPDPTTATGPRCLEQSASAAAGVKGLPAMALPCFDGGRYTNIADLAGQPTVVNLWGSYCAPCLQELPALESFAKTAQGKVRVVGIVTKDRHDMAQAVIDDKKITFPMLEDQGQQFAIAASPLVSKALTALPATLFVTADGRIAFAYQGPALTEDATKALVQEHLGVAV